MRWDHSRFHFEWLGLFKQIQRKPPYIWFRGVCIPGNEFVRQKWGNSLPRWVIEDILAGYECHFIPGLTGIVITHSTWNAYEVTRKTHGMRGAALDLAITVNEENLRFHLGEVEVKLLWFMCLFTDFLGYVFFCSQIWAFCTPLGFSVPRKSFLSLFWYPPVPGKKETARSTIRWIDLTKGWEKGRSPVPVGMRWFMQDVMWQECCQSTSACWFSLHRSATLKKILIVIFTTRTHRIRMYAMNMVTFTINIPQMLAYIPYMDPMGKTRKNIRQKGGIRPRYVSAGHAMDLVDTCCGGWIWLVVGGPPLHPSFLVVPITNKISNHQ